jgi:hypothetical protein
MEVDAHELARICARAKSGGHVTRPAVSEDVTSLLTELSDLFWAMGLLDDGTRERTLWLQLSRERTPHDDLAKGFERMARAKNPLSPEVCFGDIAKILQRKLAVHWARKVQTQATKNPIALAYLDWDQLTSDERSGVRRMAGDLAAYHHSFVRRHRPRKDHLDALLWQLADLFARHAGWREDVLFLGSAERSLFIQFCHLALKPLSGRGAPFAISEVSVQALSERWRRLVGQARKRPLAVRPKRRRSPTLRQSRRKPQWS